MTNEKAYQNAMNAIRAGRYADARATLADMLESADAADLRAYILIALAEVEVAHFNAPATSAHYLAELASILSENGNLPSTHRAAYATLQAQVHAKNGAHADACTLLKDAARIYGAHGDGQKALNASFLLAASLLASGDAAGALVVCREIRLNVNCTPRLLELNVLQAKVETALGKGDAGRFTSRVVEGLRDRLGASDFRALVEVLALDGAAFVKYANDSTFGAQFPAASVLG